MKTASIFLKKKLEENIDHFLDNSQIHYLKKVLKIKNGEHIYIYDGQGNRNLAIFNGKDSIKVIERENQKRKFKITALVPILRKIQFEFQLQKIVEVGVKNIVCYISAKTKDEAKKHCKKVGGKPFESSETVKFYVEFTKIDGPITEKSVSKSQQRLFGMVQIRCFMGS